MKDSPTTFDLDKVDRTYGAVFLTDNKQFEGVEQAIRGMVKVNLNLRVSSSQGLIVVYLLDCDENDNTAALVTHAPYTYSDLQPGRFTILHA